jgi:predicted RNA-binding Zn-ribbon protein involved in translation (DUF1610 family)
MPGEKPLAVTPANPRKPHRRVIRTRPVTFVCQECGQEVTENLSSGPLPKYCHACAREVRRRQNAARVKRHREKKRRRG